MKDIEEHINNLIQDYGNAFWEAAFALGNTIGFCECGRPGRAMAAGPLQFGISDRCKTAWLLVSRHHLLDLDSESREAWIANNAFLHGCRIIVPRYPCVVMFGGGLKMCSEIESFIATWSNGELSNPARAVI